jgi:hypothetical protein
MSYTPSALAAYRSKGWTVLKPQQGDLAFFNFSGGRTPQHVGLVVAVNADGSLITVEGNTSPGDSGSQSNGGGVFRRIRPTRYVVGYGRPRYAPPAPIPVPAPPASTLEIDMQIQLVDVPIATDASGNGWASVPHQIGRIIGVLPPGLRPGADGRYETAEVGFAQEDPNTIVSVTGWTPGTTCVVRLRVAS